MGIEGPIIDCWGDVSVSKIRCDTLEMFKGVQVTELYIFRSANTYPEGCELKLTVDHDPSIVMKVTILGEPFKQLQKLILATMGFEDADEIE